MFQILILSQKDMSAAKNRKAPSSSSSSSSSADSNKRKPDEDAAKAFLGNLFGKTGGGNKAVKVEKADSPWSPKKKSKVTNCVLYKIYVYVAGVKLLAHIFINNCYDRCAWLKSEVEYEGEMCILSGLELLYAATRQRRFAQNIHDFTEVPVLEGTSCPMLLKTQGPIWSKCALEESMEATVAASAELEAFAEQFERILPGSPDLSNRSTFDLTTTVIEYAEEDEDGTAMVCKHLVALKPANYAA
jgi:hypothetical protein